MLQSDYIVGFTNQADIDDLVGISLAFVAHTAQKPRAIYEYKDVNSFTETASCKYETLPELAQSLRPNDAFLAWDVKNAYHRLLLRLADRKYRAVCCLGRYFVPITMPFGLAPAPMTWTMVMRPVGHHLRGMGLRIIPYVDGFGRAPPAMPGEPVTLQQAVEAYKYVDRLFCELGLRIHPTKGTKDGPTCVRLLGHLVDTGLARCLLPPDRVDKIVNLAVGLSRRATDDRRWVNFQSLRRFCGIAVLATLSVPSARYHLRSLFTAMQLHLPRKGDVQLGHQALKDLPWLTELRDNAATGRPLWLGATIMLLVTDASATGWGAVLDLSAEARGCHGVDRNGLHINCLELGAVTRALQSFRRLIPAGSIIRLLTDSAVALHVMRAGSSRSPVLMGDMRILYNLCTEMDVQLRIEHVSSVLNEWADRLSREHNTTDWTLQLAKFSVPDDKYGPHSIDLFASTESAQCPKFYSRWMCLGSLATSPSL